MSNLYLRPCKVCHLHPYICICNIGPGGRYLTDAERAERMKAPPSEAVRRGMDEIAALRKPKQDAA